MLAIVTGASRGLGRRCARRLAAAGADLLLVARDSMALTKVADEAITRGGPIRVSALGCDLTDREAPEILRDAAERLGGADILVNNAAIQGPIGQALGGLVARFRGSILARLPCAGSIVPCLHSGYEGEGSRLDY